MRTLPFLVLAAGLMAGCGDGSTDTADSGSGKDTDTGGGDTQDTQETGDTNNEPDTAWARVYLYGDYEVGQGKVQAATMGYAFTDPSYSTFLCEVEGTVDADSSAPSDCASCEWSYTFTVTTGSPTGDGCSHYDTTGDDFSGTQGLGWAAEYTYVGYYGYYYDTDVIFRYYAGYGWYEAAYNNELYGSSGYVEGDGTSGTFLSLAFYDYYIY